MMTQFLYMLSCSFRLGVAAFGRNCARSSCTSWCGDTRGLCAPQWFGWVTNVFDYRSNGAALDCALSHRHWCDTPVVNCWLLTRRLQPNHAHGLVQDEWQRAQLV